MTSIDRPSTLAEAVGRESMLARRVLGMCLLGAVSLVGLQLATGRVGMAAALVAAKATGPLIVEVGPQFQTPEWVIDSDKIPPVELAAPPGLEPPPVTAVASWRLPS